jgi:hypothetical protein
MSGPFVFINNDIAQSYSNTAVYSNIDAFKISGKFDVANSGAVKVYKSFTVNNNVIVSGNTTLGGAGKKITSTGVLSHTGNLIVTGNTALGDSVADITSISGSATVAKNLSVTGNTTITGALTAASINLTGGTTAGTILKSTVLAGTEAGGGTYTNSTTNYTDVVSYSYTPVSSSSYLVIEFICRYYITGSGGDTWNARITVDGGEIGYTQERNDARAGPLTPFWVRYTNSSVTAKTIAYQAARASSDDTITFYAAENGCYLRITEIAR